jgi:hypothetical protein
MDATDCSSRSSCAPQNNSRQRIFAQARPPSLAVVLAVAHYWGVTLRLTSRRTEGRSIERRARVDQMKRLVIALVLAVGLMVTTAGSARASGCCSGPGYFSFGLTFHWNWGGGCGCGYPAPAVYSAPPPAYDHGYGYGAPFGNGPGPDHGPGYGGYGYGYGY